MAHVDGSGTAVVIGDGPVREVITPLEVACGVGSISVMLNVATSNKANEGGLDGGKTELRASGLVPCCWKVSWISTSPWTVSNFSCGKLLANLGRIAPRECEGVHSSLRGTVATKQSILPLRGTMDCFAEPVIGRAFARPVGSQ
jgi:hypothetical protein